MDKKIYTDHIFTVENFWTAQECDAYIHKSEQLGYEQAKIITDFGARVVESVRNNTRVLHTDFELAQQLWERLKTFMPEKYGNSIPIGLNELFRFYRYEPGQRFNKHRDQSYIRNDSEASYFTFMIYLNDGYEGGETMFNSVSIHPQKGTALIFQHNLEHEGTELKSGIKYVLRTDIMYKLNA